MAGELAAGARLGPFELAELLNRGETSAVYRARETATGRAVALKVPLGGNPADLDRFRREARLAASLRHRHIVEAIQAGEEGGRPFLAMELVAGGDLAELLAREGRPTAARTLLMLKQAASALAHLHAAGIVHCDLQPSNLLVTELGEVKLADFGLARNLDEDEEPRVGSPTDSPLYFPPEAAHGRELDERSDLYLLGATFYHALAGRPPFEAADPVERALKYVRGDVPPLSQAVPTLPAPLCEVIHRLLAKNPSERFQSAPDLLAALERIEVEMARGRRKRAPRGAAPVPAPAVPRLACPAVSPLSTVGQADRGTEDSSAPVSAPAPPSSARLPLAAPVGGGVALLAVGILIGYFLGRAAGPRAPGGHSQRPATSASSEPGDEGPETGPRGRPDSEGGKAPGPAPASASPASAAWRGVWEQAEADAARLVRAQRFGAAIACYEEVARRFGKDVPAEGLAAATRAVRERAEAAYAATAAFVKQMADGKRFEAARGELLGVIERCGLDDLAGRAKELLATLAEAEKQAKTDPERQRAEAARAREADARFQQAMAPAEALARARDFRGALAKLPPPEGLPAERLDARRGQLERLAKLKDQIAARINAAKPPLRKSAVLLPGVNGDLVKADEDGITTQAADGKTEVFAWASLSQRSARSLVLLAIDPNSADDHLAAALLALVCDDLDAAEQELARARQLGADVARAQALLDSRRKQP